MIGSSMANGGFCIETNLVHAALEKCSYPSCSVRDLPDCNRSASPVSASQFRTYHMTVVELEPVVHRASRG